MKSLLVGIILITVSLGISYLAILNPSISVPIIGILILSGIAYVVGEVTINEFWR